jgi:hypothetical protein
MTSPSTSADFQTQRASACAPFRPGQAGAGRPTRIVTDALPLPLK